MLMSCSVSQLNFFIGLYTVVQKSGQNIMNIVLKNWIFPLGLHVSAVAVCSIFFATGVEASADTYLGCYYANGTEEEFAQESMTTMSNLASAGCREKCQQKFIHSFAGILGGTFCYCAQQLKDGQVVKVNDSLCNVPCPGDSTEFCGGSNDSAKLSVYSVCSKGFFGRNCDISCNCKDNASCAVHGVCPENECAVGWKLNMMIATRWKCSDDINECEIECNPTNSINCHNCRSDLHQKCQNTKGSFTCICKGGYQDKAKNGTCTDIDECARNDTHNCSQLCTNTEGSHTCSCLSGYELDGSFKCSDINECAKNTSGCEQICNNTDGGYTCGCNNGFRQNVNSRLKCDDIDECAENSANCNQTCHNAIGNYSCSCRTGYELDNDRHKCNDIDECYNNTSNCGQECENNVGSYICKCNTGFELLSDQHQCEDIDECNLKTSDCNQLCTNTYGWYNCSCYTGYQFENESICIDVNECAINKGGCLHYCNNTAGSFVCSCAPGYKISTRIGESYNCSDIDECEERTSECEHMCNNTVGGYNCSCHSGFRLKDDLRKCRDVDECVDRIHNCNHTCNNKFGSYSCSCHPGFYLDGEFTCYKDHTLMILGVVIGILIIWILIVVFILLKIKRMFPFDDSKFSKSGQDTKEAAVKKPKETCIEVNSLREYIEKIRKSSGFEEEFKSVPMVSDLSYELAQSQTLKSKNRFKNILPYDDNRVILDEVNNDRLSTYINASFIKGYNPNNKIIASHGPSPHTQNDFWRMIWQFDVSVIVMVTKCMEGSKRKCEQYWPLEGSMESDEITISVVSTDNFPDYIITYLKVAKENTSRLLVHLLFTAWPDHGAPDHATSLLSFRRAARNVIDADKYFLVHCSAGVGRTGTFLAIDFLLQQAKDKGYIDVYKYLEGLRDQRMHAVQTVDQYEFIHLALLEALTLGETVASCSALSEHRKYLNSLNPLTGKSYIQTEFDMLQEMHPPLSAEATTAALENDNVSRNRDPKLLPGDVNRVLLMDMDTESDYINAVYVSNYRLKNAFISAELPLDETLKNFWAMVVAFNCKLVAFLDTSPASDDLNNHLLVPVKTKLSVGRHKVWTHSSEPEKLSDQCCSYSVAVANPPDDDEDIYANAEEIPSFKVLVLHFQLSGHLAKLLPKVNEQIKASSQNIKDNGPVVIVSRDGVNPTGQFIAVSNLIEMATSQNEVDVFNAVHNIKKMQPYFITSLDEYQMIFDAVEAKSEAESDTSTYANI